MTSNNDAMMRKPSGKGQSFEPGPLLLTCSVASSQASGSTRDRLVS